MRIALTPGEPAGIGPDLIIQTNMSKDASRLFVDVKKIAGMCDATLTSARKIDIAQQILQGALFLSEQKFVS